MFFSFSSKGHLVTYYRLSHEAKGHKRAYAAVEENELKQRYKANRHSKVKV